jgi:hypothetical protein
MARPAALKRPAAAAKGKKPAVSPLAAVKAESQSIEHAVKGRPTVNRGGAARKKRTKVAFTPS